VNRQGVALDTGVCISASSGVSEYRPNIACDGERCLVVWYKSSTGIYGRFVNREGLPEGNVLTVASNGTGGPNLAFDGTNYLVVWFTGAYPDLEIYGRSFRRKGYGTQLFNELAKRLKAIKLKKVVAMCAPPDYWFSGVDVRHTPALFFFKTNKFHKWGQRVNLSVDLTSPDFAREPEMRKGKCIIQNNMFDLIYSMGLPRISIGDGGCSAALKKMTPRITSATAPTITPMGAKKMVIKQMPLAIVV
jgi:GNAT superfamily N-acetyltransferase